MRIFTERMKKELQAKREHTEERDLASKLTSAMPFLGMLAILALVIAGVWVVWNVPQWQLERYPALALHADPAKQIELEDTLRKTLTQIVLGVFGLILLYFTWRRARAGDATVRIMEQGHITDRFTKAIEQLGALDSTGKPNIEVRLGAIYALERIALDSPRDHWTIMEVLTAYVRQNAPNPPDSPSPKSPPPTAPASSQWHMSGTLTATRTSLAQEASRPSTPSTDIQAVLTVLGRRKRGSRRERLGQRLDLSNSHLEGANLREANLRYADLRFANLRGVNLIIADLEGAYLRGANLQGADLSFAMLHKAQLSPASLQGANLAYANLREITYTNLWDVDSLDDARELGWEGLPAYLLQVSALTAEHIRSARGWELAEYSEEFRKVLGLPEDPPPADQP